MALRGPKPLDIQVYANPYAGGMRVLSAYGYPGGFVTNLDSGQVIGAVFRDERYFASLLPCSVRVANINELGFYRNIMLEGYLLTADPVTAKKMNVPLTPDPVHAVLKSHQRAVDEWRAAFDSDPACVDDFNLETRETT